MLKGRNHFNYHLFAHSEDTALFLNVRTSKNSLWPEWQVAREVPLNLGGEVGWHVPRSHVADFSLRSDKQNRGSLHLSIIHLSSGQKLPLVIRIMKAPLCRNPHEPTCTMECNKFFFSMAHLMPFWQMLFFFWSDWLVPQINSCFFLEIPAVMGPWSFRPSPLVPSSMSHLQVVVEAYAKLQFRDKALFKVFSKAIQRRHSLGDFAAMVWRMENPGTVFFPISWCLILLGCNTWVAEHVINPAH